MWPSPDPNISFISCCLAMSEYSTNCAKHAELELNILFKDGPNDNLLFEFRKEIIDLCERFGKSGQSGSSAPYVAEQLSKVVKQLCLHESITPLTGKDWEWEDVSHLGGNPSFQNKRNSAVFKDSKDGPPYYLDAIVKRMADGGLWSGGFWGSEVDMHFGDDNARLTTTMYIKSFPFTPKTFFVDVEEVEMEGNGPIGVYAKDVDQLKEVYKYYGNHRLA